MLYLVHQYWGGETLLIGACGDECRAKKWCPFKFFLIHEELIVVYHHAPDSIQTK